MSECNEDVPKQVKGDACTPGQRCCKGEHFGARREKAQTIGKLIDSRAGVCKRIEHRPPRSSEWNFSHVYIRKNALKRTQRKCYLPLRARSQRQKRQARYWESTEGYNLSEVLERSVESGAVDGHRPRADYSSDNFVPQQSIPRGASSDGSVHISSLRTSNSSASDAITQLWYFRYAHALLHFGGGR